MSDLSDLYREVIIDHSRHPQNRRKIEGATTTAEGFNPLCGDQLTLYLTIDPDREAIDDIAFEGAGCAISVASASLMTAALKGRRVDEAAALFEEVRAMLAGGGHIADDSPQVEKLEVLAGVAEFPMRVKCATLAWHTLRSALNEPGARVTSEDDPSKQEPVMTKRPDDA